MKRAYKLKKRVRLSEAELKAFRIALINTKVRGYHRVSKEQGEFEWKGKK